MDAPSKPTTPTPSGLKNSVSTISPLPVAKTRRSAKCSTGCDNRVSASPMVLPSAPRPTFTTCGKTGCRKLNRGEASLEHTGEKIRGLILAGTTPKTLRAAIVKSYRKLTRLTGSQAVAVRSSATAEDLPEASFAGQQASFLNVRGETELLDAHKRCYASLFTDRAISYREAQGFDHFEVAFSVGVQAMVHADTGAAGVMFSLDPQTGFPHAAVITAAWGLGEAVVQGRVVPDKYQVYKPLLEKPGLSPIYEKSLGSKLEKLVYRDQGGTVWQATRDEERNRLVLNDAEILQLARWASLIEAHYGCPMDIEWAKDGVSGELFILQARPETSVSQFSDFKSNEYHHLIGGAEFEPVEANPMLGLRGAARYYSKRYREAFALECQAVKKVREQMAFDNVVVMIPFCRTPDEADRVLAIMADNGLVRGEQGLQVYVMCEIPSNVVLADQFARRFDGFSIGTNDLTQLVLGVDRDSAELAYLSDARDEAVKRMITQVIKVAHRYGCKVGICGQAPSDHPEFAEFLVRQGIDSISLNPDSITDTIAHIARAEKGSGLPQRRRMKQPPFTKGRKHYPGSMDWR